MNTMGPAVESFSTLRAGIAGPRAPIVDAVMTTPANASGWIFWMPVGEFKTGADWCTATGFAASLLRLKDLLTPAPSASERGMLACFLIYDSLWQSN